MATLHAHTTERKHGSDRLSALLIPTITAIEETWRAQIDRRLRPALRLAHEGLGRLLEHELKEQP